MSDPQRWRPVVTVCIPMLNEKGFIEECLDGFDRQTWPKELLDVVIVDGGSTDGCRQLVETDMASRPWLRVIENPARKASAAFNRGIEEAKGEVVCLFSAHGVPDPEYVTRSIAVLDETRAAGVGGRYLHVGLDRRSNAIGLAMVSPFGMASPHRYAAGRAEVDTISHPAYRREVLLDVGPFDEALERNSDYELNWRLRARGHRLVFDPSISSIYRPRGSLAALCRQFWWYGRWKVRVVRRHPASLRIRHLVAPVAVVAAGLAPILLIGRRGRVLVAAGAGAYSAAVAAATAAARPSSNDADPSVLAAAFVTMHGAWGAGFVTSVVEDVLHRD